MAASFNTLLQTYRLMIQIFTTSNWSDVRVARARLRLRARSIRVVVAGACACCRCMRERARAGVHVLVLGDTVLDVALHCTQRRLRCILRGFKSDVCAYQVMSLAMDDNSYDATLNGAAQPAVAGLAARPTHGTLDRDAA